MAEVEEKHDENEAEPEESADLTEVEQELIDKLKREFEGKEWEISDDLYVRFARAFATEENRDQVTIEALDAAMKWRDEIKIDELVERRLGDVERHESYAKNWPFYFHGVDRQGHPVWIEQMGLAEPSELIKLGFTGDDVLDFHVVAQEQNEKLKEELSKKRNLLTYQHVAIIDMQGFGKKHMSKQFLTPAKQCIEMLQTYYPGTLYRMYIVNAPSVFRKVWTVVKRWIDPVAATKIRVLGEDFIEIMKEDINPSNIPEIYGGNCLIEDCTCTEWMTYTKYKKLHKRTRSWGRKKKQL
eukprot:TRINITY_DN5431_c0_g1_i1.p1 TRINITY_DN5431_c0_g1~~TRINITY_DN5431_c0_g1_i1.p1  ORF type:complete len:298 (+),score=66.03 TRINITY_DN5431_c0_g1_i1:150-1043(+)